MTRILYLLLPLLFISAGSAPPLPRANPLYRFPYPQAGLTAKEAAAHLLSRFSFGATPGQLDAVTKRGLEAWFDEQLQAGLNDDTLHAMLASYPSLQMSTAEIVRTYPKTGQVLRKAVKAGAIEKDSVDKSNKQAYKKDVQQYMQANGLKPQADLLRQLAAQKILRAAYSNNQLQEVLTDFWFNHFNVAVSKGGVQQFVTTYERDAIRPHVLSQFETLLLATAKSPAMLVYLDNAKSSVAEANATIGQKKAAKFQEAMLDTMMQRSKSGKIKKPKEGGVNENYAREIMELHTLGVDGGNSQTDVTEAARVLTGWRINPEIEYGVQLKNYARLKKFGGVEEGDFFFAPNKHDKGEKKVLGHLFPAGGGYEEGTALIHLLAAHPATATFICRKLAVRFVSDNPPQALITKMAKTFAEHEGNIRDVLVTMVSAPEFWSKDALRAKTKSPFELAISAVRSTGAKISAPLPLYQWITKMGQKLYNYQAPTGFPDKGSYWINTGSLLNRMNFGLSFAAARIPGVQLNLAALNSNHEPESAEAALKIYTQLLLPERDVAETVKRLTPMLSDPEWGKKVDNAAAQTPGAKIQEGEITDGDIMQNKNGTKRSLATGTNTMLAQVVGIIIGSPEAQRR